MMFIKSFLFTLLFPKVEMPLHLVPNHFEYDTPHWYLRWVEFGHQLKRKPTTNEASLLKSRGEIIKKNTTIKYGHVKGSHFMQRTLNMAEMRLLPMLNEAIDKQIDKEIGRG